MLRAGGRAYPGFRKLPGLLDEPPASRAAILMPAQAARFRSGGYGNGHVPVTATGPRRMSRAGTVSSTHAIANCGPGQRFGRQLPVHRSSRFDPEIRRRGWRPTSTCTRFGRSAPAPARAADLGLQAAAMRMAGPLVAQAQTVARASTCSTRFVRLRRTSTPFSTSTRRLCGAGRWSGDGRTDPRCGSPPNVAWR